MKSASVLLFVLACQNALKKKNVYLQLILQARTKIG